MRTLFSKITFFCCSLTSSARKYTISEENCFILFSIFACFFSLLLLWFLMEFVDWVRAWIFSFSFLKASSRFFTSFLIGSILSFSCPIPLLQIRTISFLSLARSLSPTDLSSSEAFVITEKRLSISSFNALIWFEASLFFLSEFLIRSLVLCIALSITFIPALILFKSLWTDDMFATSLTDFSFCHSDWRDSIFSVRSLMIWVYTDPFPCSLSSQITSFWSFEIFGESMVPVQPRKYQII